MEVHLWMKIGEAYYKIDLNEDSLKYFRMAENAIKPKVDYLISLFIAKCLDRLKLFK